ncbi:hypothetical protein K438DRAFT_118739 [Mycena galopus ATCC 62051]|nr:hypothetical protein K438DRAFT_118739 [Mycena galopus ATCC 62051]
MERARTPRRTRRHRDAGERGRALGVDVVAGAQRLERPHFSTRALRHLIKRGGVLGEKQVRDKARSDLSPSAPGCDDDHELTSTKSVDSSAPGFAANPTLTFPQLPVDVTPSPSTTSDKAKGKPPSTPYPCARPCSASTSSMPTRLSSPPVGPRATRRGIWSVSWRPILCLRARPSAFTLDVIDANEARFAASGRGSSRSRSHRCRPSQPPPQTSRASSKSSRSTPCPCAYRPRASPPSRRARPSAAGGSSVLEDITNVTEDVRGRGRSSSKRKSSDEDGGPWDYQEERPAGESERHRRWGGHRQGDGQAPRYRGRHRARVGPQCRRRLDLCPSGHYYR